MTITSSHFSSSIEECQRKEGREEFVCFFLISIFQSSHILLLGGVQWLNEAAFIKTEDIR